MKSRYFLLSVLLGVFLLNGLCTAQLQAQPVSSSLGLGVGYTPDYEGSDDYEAVAIPAAHMAWDSGRYIELQGLKFRANLLADDMWALGPVANYRPGRDDVEDDKVDKLEDVDDAFELGLFGSVAVDKWNFSLEALQDVADGHDGFLLTLRAGYKCSLSEVLGLTWGVSTTYADGDYMQSNFGIDSRDSDRSGLKKFNADSGIKDVGVDVALSYNFVDHWSARLIGGYTRLLGDASDSPVTDDRGSDNQFFTGVVFVYTFGKDKVSGAEIEPYHF